MPSYYDMVSQYGKQYGVDPKLGESVLESESSGRPGVTSPTGARGLMQIEPSTGAGLAAQIGMKNPNLYDPQTNVHLGMYYLSQLLRHFHGNVTNAVAGYNAGGGAVDKYHGVPPYKETQNYVRTVLGRLHSLNGTPWGDSTYEHKPTPVAGWEDMKPPQKRSLLAESLNEVDQVTHTFLSGLEHSLNRVAPWAKGIW